MRRILVVLQLPSLCMVLYLDLLSVAAALWRRTPAPVPPRNRFALLVPAYNEEVLLPRLLESISALDFPHHMFDVHVVAGQLYRSNGTGCRCGRCNSARASG